MSRYQQIPDRRAIERLLEAYRSVNSFELERGEKITGRAPIIFGIYSVLLGGLAFILNNFPPNSAQDFPEEGNQQDDRGLLIVRNGQTYEQAKAERERRRANR